MTTEANKKRNIYYHKNRERELETRRKYNRTFEGFKKVKLNEWKNKTNLKSNNFDLLFDRYYYTNECEICNIEIINHKQGADKKCLDHHHDSGYMRYICCTKCNNKLGKVDRIKDKLHLELYRYFNLK